jgi:tetratricopeptide (TPR) repeat protein
MLYTFRYTFVADHYQYVASIGLIALAAAGITIAFKTKPFLKLTCCGALLLTLGILTWRQAGIYRNLETLWRDTLAKNPDCWIAHNNLGVLLRNQGRIEEAMEHYHKAIQLNPNYSESLNNLGYALAGKGRFDEAIENYRKAIQINPDFSALNNLGFALAAQGRFDEAIENYRKAIQINPHSPGTLDNLGIALASQGRFDEAIENYRKAIQINPTNVIALDNLGRALASQGRFDEAIENFHKAIQINPNHPDVFFGFGIVLTQSGRTKEAVAQYREALRLNPNLAGALNNLAWVLAASPDDELRNGAEAVRLAERACELTHHGEPLFIGTLAAAYAEAGRFPEAVTTEEKAEQLATAAGLTAVAAKDRELLELYRAGKPYHEPAPTGQ